MDGSHGGQLWDQSGRDPTMLSLLTVDVTRRTLLGPWPVCAHITSCNTYITGSFQWKFQGSGELLKGMFHREFQHKMETKSQNLCLLWERPRDQRALNGTSTRWGLGSGLWPRPGGQKGPQYGRPVAAQDGAPRTTTQGSSLWEGPGQKVEENMHSQGDFMCRILRPVFGRGGEGRKYRF